MAIGFINDTHEKNNELLSSIDKRLEALENEKKSWKNWNWPFITVTAILVCVLLFFIPNVTNDYVSLVISLSGSIASVSVGVIAILLAIKFEQRSNEATNNLKNISKDIDAQIKSLERLFDKFHEGTHKMVTQSYDFLLDKATSSANQDKSSEIKQVMNENISKVFDDFLSKIEDAKAKDQVNTEEMQNEIKELKVKIDNIASQSLDDLSSMENKLGHPYSERVFRSIIQYLSDKPRTYDDLVFFLITKHPILDEESATKAASFYLEKIKNSSYLKLKTHKYKEENYYSLFS